MSDASCLAVTDLTKSYGSIAALRGVGFAVPEGSVVGIIGRNGAGKSTLMSTIAGLLAPDQGRVSVAGQDVHRVGGPARQQIGFAPQDLSVYPTLTVDANLVFFAELYGARPAAARVRAAQAATSLGLDHLRQRSARTLSGGQKRRLHVAMAIVHDPRLLLLDEPTAGVDTETRARILDHVSTLAGAGKTVCYTSHYLPEVEQVADTLLVLAEGRIVARGTVAEIVSRYAQGRVELVFDGPPPGSPLWSDSDVAGNTVRLVAASPFDRAAELLADLGPLRSRLLSVRAVPPSLEDAYLRLTAASADSGDPADLVTAGGFGS